MMTEPPFVREVSASNWAVLTVNSAIASGEMFWRNPPMKSSLLSPPSTERSTFSPELPAKETAVIRAFVGSDGSTGSVMGAK